MLIRAKKKNFYYHRNALISFSYQEDFSNNCLVAGAREETSKGNNSVVAVCCVLLLMKMKSSTYLELQAGKNLCRSLYCCSSQTELSIFNFQLNYSINILPFLLQTQIFGIRM